MRHDYQIGTLFPYKIDNIPFIDYEEDEVLDVPIQM
jgi:hypothetical protein